MWLFEHVTLLPVKNAQLPSAPCVSQIAPVQLQPSWPKVGGPVRPDDGPAWSVVTRVPSQVMSMPLLKAAPPSRPSDAHRFPRGQLQPTTLSLRPIGIAIASPDVPGGLLSTYCM